MSLMIRMIDKLRVFAEKVLLDCRATAVATKQCSSHTARRDPTGVSRHGVAEPCTCLQ